MRGKNVGFLFVKQAYVPYFESMFKIKTHNAYIIMKIPKESYIKEKES